MIEPIFTFGLPDDAENIRQEVFTLEQGFSREIDIDEHDKEAWHLVLYLDGKPIATGRVFAETPETYHIGRVAVLKEYRGQKVGSYLVKFLITKARSNGARRVVLGSQLDKEVFYKKLGFKRILGENIYEEEGVPHVLMEKTLEKRKISAKHV